MYERRHKDAQISFSQVMGYAVLEHSSVVLFLGLTQRGRCYFLHWRVPSHPLLACALRYTAVLAQATEELWVIDTHYTEANHKPSRDSTSNAVEPLLEAGREDSGESQLLPWIYLHQTPSAPSLCLCPLPLIPGCSVVMMTHSK